MTRPSASNRGSAECNSATRHKRTTRILPEFVSSGCARSSCSPGVLLVHPLGAMAETTMSCSRQVR